MSRRKQENPQPRKRLVTRKFDIIPNQSCKVVESSDCFLETDEAEPEVLQDILTCGCCQKDFVLSDIVKFIQHKVHSCNKENYLLFGTHEHDDYDSDTNGGGGGPTPPSTASLAIVNSRRPSISAPILRRDRGGEKASAAIAVPPPPSPSPSPTGAIAAAAAPHHLPPCNSDHKPVNDLGASPSSSSAFGDDVPHPSSSSRHHHHPHHHNNNNTTNSSSAASYHHHHHHQRRSSDADRDSPRHQRALTKPQQVDAEANTTYTEPNNYVCSTCKHSFNSAWMLLQHVQNLHGMRIYVDGPLHGPGTPMAPSPASSLVDHHISHGPRSQASTPHQQQQQPPTPGPPQGPSASHPPHLPLDHHHHHHHHPFLLRLPLSERQFSPALNAHNPFIRPSSHEFRMELINNQFRLHSPGLPGLPPFDHHPHHPFERPSLLDRAPRFGLPGLEPAIDFYSKRLRELAGTTSPTTSPSPRKLTPPFSSPQPPRSSSQPSTPQPPHTPHTPTSSSSAAAAPTGGSGTPAPNNRPGGCDNTSPSSSSHQQQHSGSSGGGGGGSGKGVKSCEFCGKTFRFQSNLIVHRRSHTGEKPYKCHICNHACTQASKLKRHMKTHLNKSPGSTVSENTSIDSTSSTPDSNGALKANDRKYNHLEEEGSDAHGSVDTAENEEELEDEDEEEEEEEEDEEEMLLEDEELGSEAAEDLSTSGKSSSHHRHHRHHHHHHHRHSLLSSGANNGNGGIVGSDDSVGGRGGSGGERQSLLGEVMEKIGLSNIQHYSEAYKQALEESQTAASSRSIKEESRTLSEMLEGHGMGAGGTVGLVVAAENGLERTLRLRDDLGKGILGQPSLDLAPATMLGAYDALLESSANKRIKLELGDGGGVGPGIGRERESLYAGLWLPAMATPRDIFMGMPGGGADAADLLGRSKLSSESALKALGLPDTNSPKPGPSGGLANALGVGRESGGGCGGNNHHHHHHHHLHGSPGNGRRGSDGQSGLPSSLLCVATGNGKSKEQRRNDTCEYCGKIFKNCSNLTVHRRSHTGEKPYKCELCSYACAQSSKLTRHMKTHGRLGKDVYRCRFCDMPFSVPSTLEKHMRKCVVNQNMKTTTSETDTDSKEAT